MENIPADLFCDQGRHIKKVTFFVVGLNSLIKYLLT